MRFENKEDLLREQAALNLLLRGKRVASVSKLDPNNIDFLVVLQNGSRIAVEIKGVKRHASMNDDAQPMFSARKLVKLTDFITNKRADYAYVVWTYSDGLLMGEVRNLKGTFYFGGCHTPREGSTNDQEIMVCVPNQTLKRIKK